MVGTDRPAIRNEKSQLNVKPIHSIKIQMHTGDKVGPWFTNVIVNANEM